MTLLGFFGSINFENLAGAGRIIENQIGGLISDNAFGHFIIGNAGVEDDIADIERYGNTIEVGAFDFFHRNAGPFRIAIVLFAGSLIDRYTAPPVSIDLFPLYFAVVKEDVILDVIGAGILANAFLGLTAQTAWEGSCPDR